MTRVEKSREDPDAEGRKRAKQLDEAKTAGVDDVDAVDAVAVLR